jgi:FAD/FMN-containing dehydrogenase
MNNISQEQLVNDLVKIVGKGHVLTSSSDLEAYGRDWTRLHTPQPRVIVKPRTTEEVSAVVKHCAQNHLPLVPSGGRTGLAGGAVAASGEIVISLDRMNTILKVDKVGLTIEVEAGVTTQLVQEAAADAGLFFPLDLAAKGTSQIGGNIATNAGGVKFIRFGGMREQVLGLEVVLANGDIVNMNSGVRKNNTGYDLKQLFIGSEGTLGIITKATLKLAPRPKNVQVALMGLESFARIPMVLECIHLSGAQVTACEFFTRAAHQIVLKHAHGAQSPFSEKYPIYLLLELEDLQGAGEENASVMESLLEKMFESNLILDATIAATSSQMRELWSLRENITESIAAHGHVRKNDIALAVADLGPFIAALQALIGQLQKQSPPVQTDQDHMIGNIEIILFGHIGDGNLHINYVAPKSEDFKLFQDQARKMEEKIFGLLPSYKGSISAEHGIGLTKKKDLHYSRAENEIQMMRSIKKIFDPQNIMNPGKIFDV